MELPKGKKGPKLPPKGRGGGAAARQRYLERQRGLEVAEPCTAEGEPEAAAEAGAKGEAVEPVAGASSAARKRPRARPARPPRERGDGGR